MASTTSARKNGRQVTAAKPVHRTIVLDDPNIKAIGDMTLTLRCRTPLIMHRFSEKAKATMLGKQMGKAQGKKTPKVPEEDFLDSIYFIGKRAATTAGLAQAKFGMPAIWLKASAVRGAKLNDFAMTDARSAFFVRPDVGELIEMSCPPPTMREDAVRLQGSTTDLRHRAEFVEWEVTAHINYNVRLVSAEKLVSWFVAAGIFVGLGEMRPAGRSSTGSNGTFDVVNAEVVEPEL